ncbi:hypothetical protein LCGC14_0847390 [marine sediment metagenome]|uniref:Uncharacterized protein n=1 Tax=marine sediment metagenome TaxID=412755 RepID=A0A0F9PB86_9ZZZZ
MARSVSPLDFEFALKTLNIIASNPGLSKKQILEYLELKEDTSKLDSVITDFNNSHLNLIKREKYNKYYLNIPQEKVLSEVSTQEEKKLFWREYFLKFYLYIEILQSFSFGNSIKKVSEFTGVSMVSTGILASWAEMVGDLLRIGKDSYKISIRSVEELLNRVAVCQLGLLGCSKIEREKVLKESGMRVDVYGFDKGNNKEYYIESESSASKLNDGIMQAHTWISQKRNNLEKWVLIPKETLKETSFETLEKRFNTARNRNILIKLCPLTRTKWPEISSLEIPRPKDLEIFKKILKIIKAKKFITIDDVADFTKKPQSFVERIERFGLMYKDQDNSYSPSFKI